VQSSCIDVRQISVREDVGIACRREYSGVVRGADGDGQQDGRTVSGAYTLGRQYLVSTADIQSGYPDSAIRDSLLKATDKIHLQQEGSCQAGRKVVTKASHSRER
jgi:hypothetical protein